MVRTGFFLCLFWFVYLSALAQIQILSDPYLKFDHLTKKDGLSNNYILDFYQDNDGFLWIATKDGLNRYDGYVFKTYTHNPLDSLSISDNLITSITGDENGNLWIGTSNGLNKYNPQNGNFSRYYFSDDTNLAVDGNFIRAILPDDSTTFWIETADGILHKFNPFNSVDKKFTHGRPGLFNTYLYHTIFKDKNGDLWIGGRYMGIYRFNTRLEEFIIFKENPNDDTKKRDNDVSVYFRDSDGIFWVAGTDGLYTFDEKTAIFQKKLPVSTFSIKEDGHKKLWIGTGNGIYLLDKKENKFRHFTHNDNNRYSIINDHVNKIFIDRNGNTWIGTIDGISIYRPSKNKSRQIYHVPENDNTPVSNHITCILEDSKNRIWIGSVNEGLEGFDQDLNKIFEYSTKKAPPFQLVSDNISTLMEDKDGDIWVGLWSGRGFHIVNPDTEKNLHYKLHEETLKADWYNDFLQDSKGNYWIGIWGGQGLYNFDKKNNWFKNERFNLIYHTYNTPVMGIFHDGKIVWPILINQNRFFCLDPKISKFSTYSRDHYFDFDFNKINDLMPDKNGNLLFQTNGGTYLKTNFPYFLFSNINQNAVTTKEKDGFTELEHLIGQEVLCSINDESGNTWVGTYNGLYKVKGKGVEHLYQYSGENVDGLINDTIWSMDFNKPRELWIGTNKGICMLDINTNKFISYNEQKNLYLSSHLVRCVFEDDDGYIWVGTSNNGVNRLHSGNNQIEQFNPNPDDSAAFWGEETSCIFQDSRGIIWIGGMGLNKFDPENMSFTHITQTNGLANNNVNCILEDNAGFLWISTEFGLSKLNPVNLTFENYYEKDGLQENEFSRAGFKLKNGLLLFGGKNGISVIDPENLKLNKQPPQIAITGFKIFDKVSNIKFNESERIQLKYDQNYFSFEFTALDFSNPLLNTFAYTLENFDNDWNYTQGANRVAKYTNVDPGHYLFRIKAANPDGTWNETGLAIPLIIRPPFWKTTWFYLFEFLLLIAAIVFIVKFREKKMREQNRFLTLEQKLLRSQMNPHFIFNSLSSIQSFIFESNPMEAGTYLSRFAELIRSILYNSREEYIPIEKEIKTLQNYLDLQKLRYNNKFEYDIDVDPLLDIENTSIPPMLAQPFIENAIEHGIKYIVQKGLISVSFTLLDDSILFIIEDNGIGMEAAKKQDEKRSKDHISLATTITSERIEIFNKGNKRKPFSMQIADVKDVAGNVTGTKVKLIIPYLQT